MNVRILAASDRNNYGDLLFPLVIKKYLEIGNSKVSNLDNYGIIESDLSLYGALPTKSFDQLILDIQNSNKEELIVVAGGEVLGSNWLNIYRFLHPFYSRLYKSSFLRRLLNKFDFFSLYFSIFKGSSFPFILDGKVFNRKTKIAYSSIGGSNIESYLRKSKNLVSYFNKVKNLSIRDYKTESAFNKFNIANKLVPDSALIMADIFKGELDSQLSSEVLDLSTQDYVYVQLGNTKGPDDLPNFADKLNIFCAKNNLKIVLSPIGLALDHDDEVILRKLQTYCHNAVYVHPNNIYDTMALLKNAKLYLGTSLHGVVTSQSFNVPFVAFTEKIHKLHLYIKTWFPNYENISIDYASFDKVNIVFSQFDADTAKIETERQKKMIYSNLHSIFDNG